MEPFWTGTTRCMHERAATAMDPDATELVAAHTADDNVPTWRPVSDRVLVVDTRDGTPWKRAANRPTSRGVSGIGSPTGWSMFETLHAAAQRDYICFPRVEVSWWQPIPNEPPNLYVIIRWFPAPAENAPELRAGNWHTTLISCYPYFAATRSWRRRQRDRLRRFVLTCLIGMPMPTTLSLGPPPWPRSGNFGLRNTAATFAERLQRDVVAFLAGRRMWVDARSLHVSWT